MRSHGTAACCAVLLPMLAGCGGAGETEETRRIRAHWIPACAPPADGPPARITLTALGDFEPSARHVEILDEADRDERLVIPPSTLGVELLATDHRNRWHGVGGLDPDGNIDIPLWPESGACSLFTASPESGAHPGPLGGQGIGASLESGVVLVAGGDTRAEANEAAGTVVVDLRTGAAAAVPPEHGLRALRAFPTVTALGDHLLVAGGRDPLSPDVDAHGTAELFDPSTGRFLDSVVPLSSPRARHGAAVLPTGETVLVGGETTGGRALRTLEAVAAETRRARVGGLATLSVGRVSPRVLTLTDGRILVAGGYDDDGAPVSELEWLAPDASRVEQRRSLGEWRPTADRAFVAMPGGAVLAVGGCELDVSPAEPDEARRCERCADHGSACPSRDVLWIRGDGEVSVLDGALDPADSVPSPMLVAASNGSPWLVVDTERRGPDGPIFERALRRFDPWRGRFLAQTPRPAPGPGGVFPAPLPVDPGLFVWLAETSDGVGIFGFRHDTRNELTQDIGPLLLTGPQHLAPDRPPGEGVDYVQAAAGGLQLEPGAAAWVTDTTYAEVRLELRIGAGPPPTLLIGRHALGEDGCPWPPGPHAEPYTLRVEREASRVTLERDDGERADCVIGEGRHAIGLRGSADGGVTVRELSIRRGAAP